MVELSPVTLVEFCIIAVFVRVWSADSAKTRIKTLILRGKEWKLGDRPAPFTGFFLIDQTGQ